MKKIFAIFLSVVITMSLVACGNSESHEGEAKTPSGSSAQKGRDYQEVVKDFEEKGFTNISLIPLDDLITGWLTKDGEVESVSVDGDENYSPDRWYPNDVKVVISYHTFPEDKPDDSEKESSENDSIDIANESAESESVENTILTIENCEDFASILLKNAEVDSSYSDFAEAYKGRTIEFDGCITYLINHDDYDTRYDILLSAGDYVDEDTANPGPVFKFEDVNTMNLGIEDLFLPGFVSIGNNVHVIAEVKDFNSDTGLFFLNPVSVTER